MKSILLSTAIFLTIAAGCANAGEPNSLAPVNVRSHVSAARVKEVADCAPPNASVSCEEFHSEIRRNFSTREIGMLFGTAASYPEYRTSYSRVARRYENFVQDYEGQSRAVAAK